MLGLSWIMLALIKKRQVPRDVLVNVPILVSKVGSSASSNDTAALGSMAGMALRNGGLWYLRHGVSSSRTVDLICLNLIKFIRPHLLFSLSFYLLHFIIFWNFRVSLFPSGISQLHQGFSQHFINKRIQQPAAPGKLLIFHDFPCPVRRGTCASRLRGVVHGCPWRGACQHMSAMSAMSAMSMSLRWHVTWQTWQRWSPVHSSERRFQRWQRWSCPS